MKLSYRILLSAIAFSTAFALGSTPEQTKAQDLNGTEISGNIHGMLSAEKSPYLVTSDIFVDEDQALYIQAGVTLLFKDGTGFYVKEGALSVSGQESAPVTFRSANEASQVGAWKGLFVSGDEQSTLRGLTISHAENGIVVENGKLDLQSSKIEETASRGLFVRNAQVSVMNTSFENNKGVAFHASNYAITNIDHSTFVNNNIAILHSELSHTQINNSSLKSNKIAVVAKENNLLLSNNSEITENEVGAAGADILDESVRASIKGNKKDFDKSSINVLSTLSTNPEMEGIKKRPFNPNDKIGVLVREESEQDETLGVSEKRWNIVGNTKLGGKFHFVSTATNDEDDTEIDGHVIKHGEDYRNVFQVPGLEVNASAYLFMQAPTGETIEFNTDITGNSWNHFSPNPVTLTYTGNFSSVILGDEQKVGGEIYMEALPLFGIDYTLTLLKNNADQPLFELNGFTGEAQRSLAPGARNPNIYKDYIEDGTAQAQRLAYGGSFKWAPVRRFDAKFGVIVANDEAKDPLLRDGFKNSVITADPMIKALTAYADGNWLFFPGDIELNGQIAVGHADTADVIRERAINQVFDAAGITTTSFSQLRKFMQNPSYINYLSHAELVDIFGDDSGLRDSQMKDSLRTLITNAKKVQKETESDRDDDRVLGMNWGSQDIALKASLNWNIYKTRISGHVKYVGEDFYSAGSPNQQADTREFGGRLEQDFFDFWTFGFNYQINVENAAKKGNTNIFGLGEGSRWGLFSEPSESWEDEHELDNDRTKYIQNIGTDQKFNVGKNITLSAAYNLQYQTQHRNFQLHGDYMLEDEIFKDDWFKARKGKATSDVVLNGDTTKVDYDRWNKYNSYIGEEYLASDFMERVYKHSIDFGVSLKAFKTLFNANGHWTFRKDNSEFEKDDLISDMDLSNETFGKLGYYFGGADYFEQRYTVSASTDVKSIQNRISATPRFKSYERDDMEELEIIVDEEFSISLIDKFLLMDLSGTFRFMETTWNDNGTDQSETETDYIGAINLRVNHTKHFYSEWGGGISVYSRPDDLSSEYTDIFCGASASYIF